MKSIRLVGLVALLLALTVGTALASDIKGTYIESRNAEIYASHCFANSEVGITGDLAVMAWSIDSGSLGGVSLEGLNVVAVVKASSTIGNPFGSPLPAKTMMIVDETASAEQREALVAFAQEQVGELAANVVLTEVAPISIDFHGDMHAKVATLKAGELVALETREIRGSDSLCHLDDIYYMPLVALDHAMPAFAVEQSFRGDGLNYQMHQFARSSAYLGTFSVSDEQVSGD
jgi:hypothetical protein